MIPQDQHNESLLANVHPADWTNPQPADRYNLVVIGAGTAGLVAAAGAAGLGARVALVEKHLMGGDCLNFGCVPSKTLLRSARALADVRRGNEFGIVGMEQARADFPAVMERVRRIRAEISSHDSARRFRDELGVDVFIGEGGFADANTVFVDGAALRFKKAVIATGARPVMPPIPGLAESGPLTNESVFNLTDLPERLLVIGGGPIGCELAQAFRRLGSDVTLAQRGPRLLPRDDPEASELLAGVFRREGIRVLVNANVNNVTAGADKRIEIEADGKTETVEADAILVAAGRAANVEDLGLAAAGVEYGRAGVKVDDFLRTTNPAIFAAGDVASRFKFTHAADFAARIVIQNALFHGRRRASSLVIPWCTYTGPEIAHVGLFEEEARQQGTKTVTLKLDLGEVDRAITDGATEGFVKVHLQKGSDKIVGATVVAEHAGEMIGELSLAMTGKIGLSAVANAIHPYPTQAEAIRRLGDLYNRSRLTPTLKWIFRQWLARAR